MKFIEAAEAAVRQFLSNIGYFQCILTVELQQQKSTQFTSVHCKPEISV